MPSLDSIHLEFLAAPMLPAATPDLVELLCASVQSGASIGFLAPLTPIVARKYWQALHEPLRDRHMSLLVARDGTEGPIVGSGQLAFESKQTGWHRTEVRKVMVLPAYRRAGVATVIMQELERHARERQRRLLFLDTSEGPSGACAFYERLGYTYAGGIPDWAFDPDGTPRKNAIYDKLLT